MYLGFNTREEYVLDLADSLGVPHDIALIAAQMLGPNEDQDGLVTELEDYAESHSTYWVEAGDKDEALDIANNDFSVLADDVDENYEQDTLSVEEIAP